MAGSTYKLTVPSSTRHLEEVRRFVERHARAAQLSREAIEQLKIAVDEACTNVIKHAYRGEAVHEIDIAVLVKPDRFTVRIRDQGRAFQPACYEEPNIFKAVQRRRAGGFGVHIMRRLMDQVEYRTYGETNEVSLTKYRRDGSDRRNGDH